MAAVKVTPEETRKKLVEAFSYRVEMTSQGNEKKKAAARKVLAKMALKHPDVAEELGIPVVPKGVSRVMQFRCLSQPVVLDRPEWENAATLQITLAHDLYNRCVESCNQLYALIREELLQGEGFRKFLALEDELSEAYSLKGRLYFEAREQKKTPELRVLNATLRKLQEACKSGELKGEDAIEAEAKIEALKAERDDMLATPEYRAALATISRLKAAKKDLYEAVYAEMKEFQKSDLRKQIGTGQNKGGLLYEATYKWYSVFTEKGLYKPSPTINEVRVAFLATLKDPLQLCRKTNGVYRPLKGRYGDSQGNLPASIADYPRWNGEGKLGVEITNSMRGAGESKSPNPDRTVSSVMLGTNSSFRLRPMVEADLGRFPMRQKIDLARKSSQRIHIAEIAVVGPKKAGEKVFASVPVILHRPLPEDGEFISADCHIKKEGGHKVVSLLVTVNIPPKEATKTGVEASIQSTAEGSKQTWSVSRSDAPDFHLWLQYKPGLHFGWLSPDGRLTDNPYIAAAQANSKNLFSIANEYADSAIASLKELGQGLALPGYLTLPQTRSLTRGDVYAKYQQWRKTEITAQAAISTEAAEAVRAKFRTLRQLGRERVKEDWDAAVVQLGSEVEKLFSLPHVEGRDQVKYGQFLAVLSLFAERWDHLNPWATNLSRNSLRRRKDEYRKFAAEFLKGVSQVILPAPKKGRRPGLTDEQKTLALSSLIEAIKSVAAREGLAVIERS